MDTPGTIAESPAGTAPRKLPARNRLTAGERMVSGAVGAACLAILSFAAWLEPAPAGHGTHEQLGLAPCPWPYFFGIPCPTCGMTTAFAHAADGDLLHGLRAQPFGFLLSLGISSAFWVALYGCATGSRAGGVYGTMLRPKVLWGLAALAAAAWAYKVVTWPGV